MLMEDLNSPMHEEIEFENTDTVAKLGKQVVADEEKKEDRIDFKNLVMPVD